MRWPAMAAGLDGSIQAGTIVQLVLCLLACITSWIPFPLHKAGIVTHSCNVGGSKPAQTT